MPSWHNLIKYLKNCDTSHDLQNILYTKKNKTLWYLPSTFNTSHGHVRGSQYVVLIYSNLISAQDTNLNPVEFCWNSVDSIINKYTVTLPEMYKKKGCKNPQKTAIEDVSVVNLALHASVTEKKVIPKLTNKLS